MTSVLDEFSIAPGWKDIPFRSIALKVSESGFPDLESLSVFLDSGVVPRSSREDNHNQLGESLDKYQRVLPNDLVFNKLRTWQGGFGISNYEGIVSPAYIIARLDTTKINPKFLEYLLKSKPYLAELTRLSKWMPPTQFDISWENIRDLRLRIPTFDMQSEVVQYLDHYVPLIDKLIELFHEQLRLSREAFKVLVEQKTSARLNEGDNKISFRRISRIDPITSIPVAIDPLVTFLGLEDVQPGHLANFDECRILEDVATGYSRFKSGDILIPKVSPSFGHGRAVVAPSSISEVGFASTEIYVLRCNDPKDTNYVCASLRARDFLLQGESTYQGVAGVKRADREFILNWNIRWPDESIRADIAREVEEAQNKLEHLEEFTKIGVSSLKELRSSIIFEAVTGNKLQDLKVG